MPDFIEPHTCAFCSQHSNSIFRHLTPEENLILEESKICTSYKKGDIIYSENNKIKGIYCVNKGIIKIFKTGIDCKEQIIAFAKTGDIVGYRSTLSGELACTTAKILEDAEVCFIPVDLILRFIKSNGNFAMDIIQYMSKELGEANNFITEIAQKTVRERLAEVLIKLYNDFGNSSEGYIAINLTREELANLVGTATESVIRLLSEFKSDQLIELKGRKIKLINLSKLERISNVFG